MVHRVHRVPTSRNKHRSDHPHVRVLRVSHLRRMWNTKLISAYRTLHRIVIRLRVTQAVKGIKKLAAIHSVGEVIAEETRRLATARQKLSVRCSRCPNVPALIADI